MMSDDQILEVVQAHKEGKKIQVLAIHSDLGWQNCDSPSWDFARTNYRVAPEPRKPRELWLQECTRADGTGNGLWQEKFEGLGTHFREVIE